MGEIAILTTQAAFGLVFLSGGYGEVPIGLRTLSSYVVLGVVATSTLDCSLRVWRLLDASTAGASSEHSQGARILDIRRGILTVYVAILITCFWR